MTKTIRLLSDSHSVAHSPETRTLPLGDPDLDVEAVV